MSIFEKFARQADVMQRMADTVGVDFVEKVQADERVAYRYREAVMRCGHCGQAAACTSWMDAHPTAAETPDYCRNKDLLASLI
ncbi:DUF6455 family protein [Thalassovita taeanensis]|uniref:DUF6455 domain-containing protein n=1 Tax=Thalassovita taeanensis TaxID=657014 RepID=A0A1H9BBA9_9RHOB|nr:DUF6455 family protein [Thalassovita taeanensis]SEP86254.1 hypothetical protein SAMN04488092_102445 [Thalassovita taeanensis]